MTEILDPEPHSAPLNMALDEVLLKRVEQPTLRIYRWAQPAVSFGYFGRIAEARALAGGREIVRRWTGGGIVEHGEDVTYTLFLPSTHPWCRTGAADSYRLVHEALAAFLERLGGHAQMVPVTGAKVGDACFANPVQYDLVAAGQKLAGAAQRRTRFGLLHQGSIQTVGLPVGWASGLAEALAARVERASLPADALGEAEALAVTRYGSVGWTERV